ncbi:SAICAR synthetase, partial [mine drainage metagenome]
MGSGRGLSEVNLAGVQLFRRGKVRDTFDLGDRLLMVATDRLSAFDCVLPDLIPDRGRVLTAMSRFWFSESARIV